MKSELIELQKRSHGRAVKVLGSRDTDENTPDGEAWTAADVMVHITGWDRWLIDVVAAARGLRSSPLVDDEDAKNALMFREGRLLSRDEVFTEAERVQQKVLAALGEVTEDDLLKQLVTGARPQPRILWRIIFGTQIHRIEHVKELLLDRGESDAAVTLYRDALEDASEVFGAGSVPFAWTSYNVACVCARTGKLEEAIAALGPAIVIDAQLAELSRSDSDLDPLRGLPEFDALYAVRS
jgi:hypothetical protein